MNSQTRLALSALMLMSPSQVLALCQLIDAPGGLSRDDPGLAALQPDLPALEPLLTVTDDRLEISSAEVRAALRAALTPYRSATDPVARLRALLSDGKTRAALACLDDLGGVFCSMIHGLDVAERIAALFPDQLREDEPGLVMLDAVNAMKSGQLARADYLVTRLQGRRRLPALDQDQSRQDYRLVTFRFVKAIYEDQPIGAQALQQLYRTLGRVPVTSPVERGLLNHVALDVYLRKGDWDAAGQAAQRALHHFDRAGARALAFYVHLYQAVIDLALGRVEAAAHALDLAAGLEQSAPGLTQNDGLLLRSLRLIQAYEAGAPQAWVDHLMTQEDSIPFGELWPAMAEPILTYGRRALGAYATHAAGLAWLRRWRVQQNRSDRFEELIAVQEIRALQAARRWQEADELLARPGLTEAKASTLAALQGAMELNARAPAVAARLETALAAPGVSVRQHAMLHMLAARNALARDDEEAAGRGLVSMTELAPPETLPCFYVEHRATLADLRAHRLLRPVLKRMPQLDRRLSRALTQAEGDSTGTPRDPFGLTRQERRILALLAEGLPNKAIAGRLGLALPTVKFHLSNLFAKLGCKSRRDAVVIAMRDGVLPK